MALQTSGQISLADLQTQYGGTNPISISEYYRGGALVVTSVSVDNSYWSSYRRGMYVQFVQQFEDYSFQIIRWYYEGVQVSPTYPYQTSGWSIRKYITEVIDEPRNVTVPTAGVVSLSNFYGGTN